MTPLQGITVLDLTRVLSGPYCTMLLADLGARVIKVEQPGKGDDTRAWGPPFQSGESAYFLSINRNKESVTLDFKQPEGRSLVERLLARADVLVENFRPGTLAKLGLDYATIQTRYPRLVYCSISGFGHTGPRRREAGYDAVMQGEGGLMSITGAADGPPYRLGVAIADIVTGMFAAQGITAALLARERTGRGQAVDIAMLDSVAALLSYQAGIYFATNRAPGRMGNRHPTIVPYETFSASDGEFVLAVGNDDQWRRFCRVADLDEDERFATNRQRVVAYDELRPLLAARLRREPRGYWIERLTAAGVPCGSVRDLAELFSDPQMAARAMVEEVQHAAVGPMRVLGTPLKLSETAASIRMPPPRLGEHTDSVLTSVAGVATTELDALRAKGVI
jgi:crotonobetainyl-CoA:carnitine CoA-transferase CaiB-like acyl-CoA transferase